MKDIKTKKLGVIGGLGPMATAYFLEVVTRLTDASCDQEHLRVLIDSNPATPDRTKFILGLSDESPYPVLLEDGKELKSIGAEVFAIPCNTAQFFHDKLEQELGAPVIHMIRETGKYLKASGITTVGLMATDGTVKAATYQNTLEEEGIRVIIPVEKDQAKVMHLIYENVKAGKPVEMKLFNAVSDNLKRRGAEVVILGCTELSIIKRDHEIGGGFIDAMEVMASAAIKACGAAVSPEYENLITE